MSSIICSILIFFSLIQNHDPNVHIDTVKIQSIQFDKANQTYNAITSANGNGDKWELSINIEKDETVNDYKGKYIVIIYDVNPKNQNDIEIIRSQVIK